MEPKKILVVGDDSLQTRTRAILAHLAEAHGDTWGRDYASLAPGVFVCKLTVDGVTRATGEDRRRADEPEYPAEPFDQLFVESAALFGIITKTESDPGLPEHIDEPAEPAEQKLTRKQTEEQILAAAQNVSTPEDRGECLMCGSGPGLKLTKVEGIDYKICPRCVEDTEPDREARRTYKAKHDAMRAQGYCSNCNGGPGLELVQVSWAGFPVCKECSESTGEHHQVPLKRPNEEFLAILDAQTPAEPPAEATPAVEPAVEITIDTVGAPAQVCVEPASSDDDSYDVFAEAALVTRDVAQKGYIRDLPVMSLFSEAETMLGATSAAPTAVADVPRPGMCSRCGTAVSSSEAAKCASIGIEPIHAGCAV